MLLFQKRFHEGLVGGAITMTFRCWAKPHVKVGGRYRCHPIGVLEVDAIDLVQLREVTAADARRAGFATRDELLAYMAQARYEKPLTDASPVYRVRFHHGGDGDRVSLALEDDPTADDIATLKEKLARMDKHEPWTQKTLSIIEKHPRVAASKLAAKLKRDTAPFKIDVRKLKRLGLTQSFEVGYEISPRGRAYLAATRRQRRR
jgi:hypothetical protein